MTNHKPGRHHGKMKVTIWIDGIGRTSATTRTRQIDKINKIQQGFTEVTSFNVPERYFLQGNGWYPAYRYFVIWATHNWGI